MSKSPQRQRWFSAIFLVLCSLIIAAQYPPFLRSPVPNRDAGAFQYMGWQMLSGAKLYRDVWDHKPPAIYYITAFSEGLFGDIAGSYLLEYLVICLSLWFLYRLLARHFPIGVARLALLLTVMAMVRLNLAGELYTSTFALLPLVLALWWADQGFDGKQQAFFIIGALGGLVLLFKFNLVAVFFAIGLVLCGQAIFNKAYKRSAVALVAMALGTLVVLLLGVLPLLWQGVLPDAQEAVITYNLDYADSAFSWQRLNDRLYNLEESHRKITFLWTMLGGWLMVVATLWHWGTSRLPNVPRPIWLVTLAFPIELFLLLSPAQAFVHYYTVLVPGGALLTAYLLHSLHHLINNATAQPRLRWLIGIAFILLFIGGSYRPTLSTLTGIRREFSKDPDERQMLSLIENYLDTDEGFLVWGAESGLYIAAERHAPTAFFYQYPLLRADYDSQDYIQQFTAEIQRHPPRLIIDTSSTNRRVPPLATEDLSSWQALPGYSQSPHLDTFFDFVQAHYSRLALESPFGWRLYLYERPP